MDKTKNVKLELLRCTQKPHMPNKVTHWDIDLEIVVLVGIDHHFFSSARRSAFLLALAGGRDRSGQQFGDRLQRLLHVHVERQ